MNNRSSRPLVVAIVLLVIAGIVAFLIARGPRGAVREVSTPAPSATPAPTPAPPTPTPFWDDPAAERERLRTPVPPKESDLRVGDEFATEAFSGQVLSADSKRGVFGAEVTSWMFDRDVYRVDDGYPEPLKSATSDIEGNFRFQPQDIPAGRTLGWIANASGYESLMLLFPEGEGQGDRLRTTFLLGMGGAISGVVVDQAGAPVVGALVGDILLPAAETGGGTATEWAATSSYAHTDDEGRFILEGLSQKKQYRIPAKAEGYVSVRTEPIATGVTDVRIVLARGDAAIVGKLLRHDGSPAADARVGLRRVGRALPGVDPRLQVSRPDAQGAYAFRDLAAGEYQIEAYLDMPEAFGPGCRVAREVVLLPGQSRTEDLELPGPATLSGRFADAATGLGIEGVVIQQAIPDATQRALAHSVSTDADGAFALVAFVPAAADGYEVRLPIQIPEGYIAPAPARGAEPWVEQDDLSFPAVKPGDSKTGQFRLERGAKIEGVVIEPDGRTPAVGATLFFAADGFFANAVADPEGKFAVHVPRDRSVDIEASSDLGIASATANGADENLRIQLLAWGSLAGVVVDEAGKAQPDLEVNVSRVGGADAFSSAIRFAESDYTDEQGRFAIDKVAFGELALDVHLSSSSPYTTPDPLRLSLAAGEKRDDLRIVLSEGDVIEGVVLDAETEKPVEGASISTSLLQVAATTDADGRFRLSNIPREASLEYVTAARAGYREETRRQVSFYAGELVFKLRPNGALELRVVDRAGTPIPNWRLTLSRDGAIVVDEPVSSPDGVHLVEDVAEGSYRAEVAELLADGSNGRGGAEEFAFDPRGGERRTVVVTVEGDLALTGVVLDGQAPAAGAVVRLLNPPASMMASAVGPPGRQALETTTDGGGAFRFAPIPRGTYRLRAQRAALVSEIATAVVADGGGEATLVLQPAPRVHGIVRDEAGEAPKAATVHVMSIDGAGESASLSVGDGAYEQVLSSAGAWRIAAAIDGTRLADSREIDVVPGQDAQVDFDFSKRVTLRGAILVDGVPPPRGAAVLLRSTLGEEAILAPDDLGGGSYEVRIAPGTWRAHYIAGSLRAPTGQTVVVAETPAEQRANIAVSTGQLEVVVVAPSDPFPSGQLVIETGIGGSFAEVLRLPLEQPALRGIALPAGNYRAMFSVAGDEVGRSPWTNLPPGGAAALVVEPQ